MVFEYFCKKCESVLERNYPVGKASKLEKCDYCNEENCERHYSDANFILKGSGWAGRTSKQKREQTQKNENAGTNMRERWEPQMPKLVPNKDGVPL